MVATGRPYVKVLKDYPNWANSNAAAKVEILDLSDPTKKCALLNDIYPAQYSGAGGLLGKNHLLVLIDFVSEN